MDFSLTSDQLSIQKLAREFTDTKVKPFAKEWDHTETFPISTFREAAKLGFGGLFVKEEHGGSCLKRLDAVLAFEQMGTGCCSTAAYLSVQNMVNYLLNHFGTKEQCQKWLPKLVTMEHFASYCLTEPDSGSDAASLKTKAVKDGDYYIVSGTKAFISGGGVSDVYLCMVRTGQEGPKGISALVIEKSTPGLSFGKPEEKMGWRNQPTTVVMLDQVKVPIKNRLGEEGEGFKIAMHGLDGGRLNIAAIAMGGAQECVDRALTYCKERKQFGQKISDFQTIQFRLADMVTELMAARLLLYKAASALDQGDPDGTQMAAMAKRFCTDTAFGVANQALQLLGGYGYIKEYEIERFVRDLRVHQILEGTNEIMRVIIAKQLLKEG